MTTAEGPAVRDEGGHSREACLGHDPRTCAVPDEAASDALAAEVAATVARRREAAAHPDEWRQGGSPGTEGCTIYQGARFVGSVRHPADAAALVTAANRLARVTAAATSDPAQPEYPQVWGVDAGIVRRVLEECGFPDLAAERDRAVKEAAELRAEVSRFTYMVGERRPAAPGGLEHPRYDRGPGRR